MTTDLDGRVHIVVLDHRDSFVHNLVQGFGVLGARLTVRRADKTTLAEVAALQPDGVVLSPGPGNPEQERWFGVGRQVVLSLGPTVPTLGVCLGHQGIAAAFGGAIVAAPTLVHGKATEVAHDGVGLFAGIPSPFPGGRYHSLMVDPQRLPDCLEVTATSVQEGLIMGLRHREFPIVGVQFHPESVLTPQGPTVMRNFVRLVQDPAPGRAVSAGGGDGA